MLLYDDWGYYCPHATHNNRDNYDTPLGQNKWRFEEYYNLPTE